MLYDLVNQDRKEYLERIRGQYEKKNEGLQRAKEMFEEDL